MKSKLLAPAALAAAFVIFGTAAQAQPACAQASLYAYEHMRSCLIGIEVFQGFTFSETGTGALASDMNIVLTPQSYADNESAGFTYSLVDGVGSATGDPTGTQIPFAVAASMTAMYNIQYHFFLLTDPAATNAQMDMDPPYGNVTINQYYCGDSSLNVNGPNGIPDCTIPTSNLSFAPTILTVNDMNPPTSWNSGNVELVPQAVSYENVLTTINLDGTGTLLGSGFDNLTASAFIDDFTPTPEPSTVVFAAGGLLVLALRKRFCSH